MSHNPKTCGDCKFCIFEDHGYSNYTVEGTTFSCFKSLNPGGSFDRFYGEDDRLKYAEECTGFEAGEAIDMDCEQENVNDLTPEQKQIWDKWTNE